MGGGLLAGSTHGAGDGRRSGVGISGLPEEAARQRETLDAYEALCRDLGEHPADVALAWLLSRPAVSATIVGSRTPEQFHASRRALDVSLDDDTLSELDRIWPGPGHAPEAYAW